MSLIISIDGAWFMMQDDKDFPWLPRIKVQSPTLTPIFDFDASKGSVTNMHDKWVWMIRSTYDKATWSTLVPGAAASRSWRAPA